MLRRLPYFATLLAGHLMAVGAHAQVPPSDQAYLKSSKIEPTAAGILEYFRSHSLRGEQIARMELLVKELGDLSYKTREAARTGLLKLGVPALPTLRRSLRDPDPERARRAASCILDIENARTERVGLAMPAARVLAKLKPPGAIEALLIYLPFNEDEWVEEEILTALTDLARDVKSLDPVVLGFLDDPHPARRAASGLVAGRSSAVEQRSAVRKLLNDPVPTVQLRAAQGLLAGRDKSAVPALIRMVGRAPASVANRAEETLFRMAGKDAPILSSSTTSSTQKRNEQAWAEWWRQHESRFNLSQAQEVQVLGLTLVAEMDSNQVWEYGPTGEVKWAIKGLAGPMHAHMLRNGNVLIAEYEGKRVTERDQKGVITQSITVSGNPIACQRLNNGNTFIATHHSVVEVTPAGKAVYNLVPSRGIFLFDAQRLPNGHVVYIANPGIIEEIDPVNDQVIRTIRLGNDFGGWCSVEMLPNGRFLIALFTEGKVQELDATGKILWQIRVEGACHATRLPNGNTLVASMTKKKVVEVDRDGKHVAERVTEGRPWRVDHR
jgi:HEAT repeat protein